MWFKCQRPSLKKKNPWQIHIVLLDCDPHSQLFLPHQRAFSTYGGVAVLKLISLTCLGLLHVYFLSQQEIKKKLGKKRERVERTAAEASSAHSGFTPRSISWFLNTKANISRHFSHFLPDYGIQSLSVLLEGVQSSTGREPVSHNTLWTLTAGPFIIFIIIVIIIFFF